jgi:uncharacterized protein YecE (DUF72 family)
VHAYVGTSGYSYDFWKGSFYPPDLEREEMLSAYARRLPAVEVNNTFYRIPKLDVVRRWAEAVPSTFRFAIKASRRITHRKKLDGCDDDLTYLYSVLEPLGEMLGATLFQCPPYLHKDVDVLARFLSSLPAHARPVLELRHASWFCEEVYDTLRAHGAVLCMADHEDEAQSTPWVATASWGYVRLRAEDYGDDALRDWATRLGEQWNTVFAFFKHEETAPTLAERLTAAFDTV